VRRGSPMASIDKVLSRKKSWIQREVKIPKQTMEGRTLKRNQKKTHLRLVMVSLLLCSSSVNADP
jgi:hypothetical protein